jgi:hypothetical protein
MAPVGLNGLSDRGMGPLPLRPDDRGCFMITCMAPARGHDDIQELITQARRSVDVFGQCDELPKINVQEAARLHFPGNPINWGNVHPFRTVGPENTIPDI